jgi:hypothetical protein
MFSNRPLFANRADERRYAETAAARAFIDSIANWQNTLLIGDPGAGKTTLLHMCELRLRDDRRPVAYVSFATVEHVAEGVLALLRAARASEWVEGLDGEIEQDLIDSRDPFAANAALRLLGDAPDGATFLVDDVNGAVGHALFGRLRDDLWQLDRISWGVASSTEHATDLVVPPADAFFERRITLGPMSADERLDFLQRRSARSSDPLAKADARRLSEEGPGNPRRLATLAREVARDPSSIAELLGGSRAVRERARAAGGRPAELLVGELERLGPVSASDRTLLERLGWTRPRAAGLLGDLEEAGVVVSHYERKPGPGRPRKLYALKDSVEGADGR